jgi:hypothetical protein
MNGIAAAVGHQVELRPDGGAERQHADGRRMRQAAHRDVHDAPFRLGHQVLHALELALAQGEHHAVVDVGAAEILIVLGEPVGRLLQRIHDHFRPHVAEQQVVAVLFSLVDEYFVAYLPGRARKEAVLEIRLQHRAPEAVEGPGQPFRTAALPRGDHHANVLGWIGLRSRVDEAERQRGAGAGDDAPARRVGMRHVLLLVVRVRILDDPPRRRNRSLKQPPRRGG